MAVSLLLVSHITCRVVCDVVSRCLAFGTVIAGASCLLSKQVVVLPFCFTLGDIRHHFFATTYCDFALQLVIL